MQPVQVFQTLPLLTLASVTLLGVEMTPTGDNEYRLLSLKGLWALRDLTAGEGPIIFGVAHGDYSDTEIEQCIENEAGLNRSDMVVTREISRRLVRRIGIFSGVAGEEVLNDGKPVHTRLNWPMAEGTTLKMWAYNQSGGSLTTGSELVFNGKWTIKWV